MINFPTAEPDFSQFALPEPEAATASNELGQEAFLTLMITQLQNQDPLQPMDDGQFIGQIAQFSTVEEIGSMSNSIESLAASLTSSTALQASTMVGRSVLVEGDTGLFGEDQPLQGGVDLPVPINNAVVQIFDVTGELVREMPLGPRAQGVATFEWDGSKSDGSAADPGTYFIRSSFMNGDTEEALATFISSRVQSVTLNTGGSSAQITTEDGQRVSLSQVKAIM